MVSAIRSSPWTLFPPLRAWLTSSQLIWWLSAQGSPFTSFAGSTAGAAGWTAPLCRRHRSAAVCRINQTPPAGWHGSSSGYGGLILVQILTDRAEIHTVRCAGGHRQITHALLKILSGSALFYRFFFQNTADTFTPFCRFYT